MAADDTSSRYYGLTPIQRVDPDGATRRLGPIRIAAPRPAHSTYQVQPGDRVDQIGEAATTDSTRWWVLADANPWADATHMEQPGAIIEVPDA